MTMPYINSTYVRTPSVVKTRNESLEWSRIIKWVYEHVEICISAKKRGTKNLRTKITGYLRLKGSTQDGFFA